MSSKKASILNIVTALFFAGTILVSGYFLKGTGYKETAMYLLIAVWFIPFSYLSGISRKNKKAECC